MIAVLESRSFGIRVPGERPDIDHGSQRRKIAHIFNRDRSNNPPPGRPFKRRAVQEPQGALATALIHDVAQGVP